MKKKVLYVSLVVLSVLAILLTGYFGYYKNSNTQKPVGNTDNQVTPQVTPKENSIQEKNVSDNIVNTSTPKIFSPEDTKMLGIEIDMRNDKVEQILGKPNKIEKEPLFGVEDGLLIYYYNFGTVSMDFLDDKYYSVSDISIDKTGFVGPRGIKVGDDVNSVMSKFPDTKIEKIEKYEGEEGSFRYLYGKNEENSGIAGYDKNENIIYLSYGYGKGFGEYGLGFTIDKGKVVEMGVSVKNN